MLSNLYRQAVAGLTDEERAALQDFEHWLEGFVKDDFGRVIRGDGVAANLSDESHLVGDGSFGAPVELAGFLRRCIEEHAKAADDDERVAGFAIACAAYEGRGLPIARGHLPDSLLRYSRNYEMARRLVEQLLGSRARQQLDDGRYSLEEAFADLSRRWDAARAPGRLGGGKMVFATFEHVGGAPRDDAAALAKTLGLPVSGADRILFEMTYPTDAVRDHRFPTVADVGWMHEFQPSPEIDPDPGTPETCYGWTRSTAGSSAQPELVHANESLRVLDLPPRFVGRLNP